MNQRDVSSMLPIFSSYTKILYFSAFFCRELYPSNTELIPNYKWSENITST